MILHSHAEQSKAKNYFLVKHAAKLKWCLFYAAAKESGSYLL